MCMYVCIRSRILCVCAYILNATSAPHFSASWPSTWQLQLQFQVISICSIVVIVCVSIYFSALGPLVCCSLDQMYMCACSHVTAFMTVLYK